MQAVIELPFSIGWFLLIAVFVSMVVLMIASYVLFMARSRITMPVPGRTPGSFIGTQVSPTNMFVLLMAFALMILGVTTWVGYEYSISQPIFNDYTWNLLGVGGVAIFIGTLVAFSVALLNFYAKSFKGRYA